MNAITLIKEQHKQVKQLFKKYEAAKSDSAKRNIFIKLADNLAAHTTIEEKVLYPAVYINDLGELLHEAVEEHLASKRVIADLLAMAPSHESFDAKVKVLQEQIEHHVKEEEEELFPKVQKTFLRSDLNSLGAEMEEMFDTLMKGEPRKDVPKEIKAAAPLT